MATIRELKASFVAQANGLKSTIQGVKREISDLKKKTKTFSNKMNDDFRRGSRSAATHIEKFAIGTQKNLEGIGNVINTTSNKFGEWSRDIKSFGKATSKALAPLTAFYATAAITGGRRMIANEQLDILMRNVFRTEKSYERAWESVRGLTKGTAFMNSDVGQWLSQLVQSNIELGKSEDIMKSILDFSVGSGQLGIEGEIHDIIMKAVRSGGWDQMTLDMMAQRGLNLAGHVANVLGISTKKAQEMLKDGSISMEKSLDYFVDAVQVGSEGAGGYFAKMADSAQKGGETMTGAWINTKAALAQLGQDMWESGAWDQLKTALNNITDFLYQLSPALEPMAKIIASIMATAVEWVQKLMTAFINLRPKTQALIASLTVVGAALGPVIYFFGTFVGVIAKTLKPLGFLFTGLGKLAGMAGKVARAFGKGGLQGVITAVGAKFPWLTRLITLFTGPVGVAVGVITLLATAFTLAYKKSEPLRNALSKTGGLLKDIYTNIKEAIPWFDIFTFTTNGLKNAFSWLFDGVKVVSDYLIKGLGFALSIAVKGFNLLLSAIKVVTENLGTFVSAIKKLFTGDFKGAFDDLLKGISDIFFGLLDLLTDFIVPIRDKALEIGKVIVTSIVDWVSKLYGKVKKHFLTFVSNIGSHIVDLKDVIVEKLSHVTTAFVKWAKELPGKMKESFSDWKDKILTWLEDRKEDIKEKLSDWVDTFKEKTSEITESVKTWIKELPGKIKEGLLNAKDAFTDWLNDQHEQNKEFYSGLGEDIKTWLSESKEKLVDGFSEWKKSTTESFEDIKETISEKLTEWKDNVVEFFTDIPPTMKEKFKEWRETVSDQFEIIKEKIAEKLTEWKESVTTFLSEMPGTIKDQVADWWEEFKQGFLDKKKEIVDGLGEWKDGILDWFKSMPKTVKDKASNFSTSFVEGIVEKKNDIVEGFNSWWDGIKDWFSNIGKKDEVKDAGKTIVEKVTEGAEEQKDDLMSRIGEIIVDTGKYILLIGGVLLLAVGRELIKRLTNGMDDTKSSVTDLISKLWENVKRIFSTKTNEIFNVLKKSFIGRIITSIINFVKDFGKKISDMWTNAKNTFVRWINNIYTSVSNSFVGRIIKSIVNFAKNFRQNISNMWSRVQLLFTRTIDKIKYNIQNSFVGRIISSVKGMKDDFIRIAKDMWTGVKKQFDKIVDGAKNLPGRIGKGISNAKNKATNAMKSVGNGIISSAGKPFNKVVDGVNWVTGKLGIKSKIPKWDYPQYAKGTRGSGHPGGIAMIGEEGEELVKLPDGRSFVSPDSHTVLDLPKGTHVVPHKPTMEILRKGMTHIPHYAKGTDGWLSSLASHVGEVFDYIKSPKKLLNKILDKISIGKQVGEIPKALVGGAWDYVKEKPYEYIKKMLGKAEEMGGALQAPVFGGKFRLSSVYGPRWGGFHGGVDFAAPTGTPIRSQSNGKVSFAGYGWNGGFGNLVRVMSGIYEHYYAHMSGVMAKTGQQVKQGDILGLVGSTGDSTGPHVHYEIRRNGQRLNPLTAGGFKGFSDGGIIDTKQLAWIAEGGWAESIISHDPSKKVRQRAIWKETGDRLGFTDDKSNKEVLEKLERIARAVEEEKGYVINIDGREAGEIIEPHITEKQNRRKGRRRRSSK